MTHGPRPDREPHLATIYLSVVSGTGRRDRVPDSLRPWTVWQERRR